MSDTDFRLIHERLDRFEQRLKKLEKDVQEMKPSYSPWQSQDPNAPYYKPPYTTYEFSRTRIPCVFDNMSPEDRMKPQSVSCPCPKCSPYCLSVGSLSDAGTAQVWYQGLAGIGDDVEEE